MPPARTLARPAVIRGQVLRHGYEVTTIADVDFYLRGLRRWLCAAIDKAPEFEMDYFERYAADVDVLLDARIALMELGG